MARGPAAGPRARRARALPRHAPQRLAQRLERLGVVDLDPLPLHRRTAGVEDELPQHVEVRQADLPDEPPLRVEIEGRGQAVHAALLQRAVEVEADVRRADPGRVPAPAPVTGIAEG